MFAGGTFQVYGMSQCYFSLGWHRASAKEYHLLRPNYFSIFWHPIAALATFSLKLSLSSIKKDARL
jgi:hypothetical protein